MCKEPVDVFKKTRRLLAAILLCVAVPFSGYLYFVVYARSAHIVVINRTGETITDVELAISEADGRSLPSSFSAIPAGGEVSVSCYRASLVSLFSASCRLSGDRILVFRPPGDCLLIGPGETVRLDVTLAGWEVRGR